MDIGLPCEVMLSREITQALETVRGWRSMVLTPTVVTVSPSVKVPPGATTLSLSVKCLALREMV